MVEKKTRDIMEGLELKVLEQHKRYGPAPLTEHLSSTHIN
jgi:hypothetical protein